MTQIIAMLSIIVNAICGITAKIHHPIKQMLRAKRLAHHHRIGKLLHKHFRYSASANTKEELRDKVKKTSCKHFFRHVIR